MLEEIVRICNWKKIIKAGSKMKSKNLKKLEILEAIELDKTENMSYWNRIWQEKQKLWEKDWDDHSMSKTP